jgi:hypothetical protein
MCVIIVHRNDAQGICAVRKDSIDVRMLSDVLGDDINVQVSAFAFEFNFSDWLAVQMKALDIKSQDVETFAE